MSIKPADLAASIMLMMPWTGRTWPSRESSPAKSF